MAKMQEEAEEAEEGSPAWMATFADLCTLLLTFFVLLLSFATQDVAKFRDMAGSVREAFGVTKTDPGPYEAASSTIVSLGEGGAVHDGPSAKVDARMEIVKKLKAAVKAQGIQGSVEIEESTEGVVLRIRDYALFSTGSADLTPEAFPLLDRISRVTLEIKEPLSIEGHTDERPISTSKFPSNWELSGARATSVLRYLVNDGVPSERVSIAGYADVRPLEPNTSDEARSRNRRVEFVFRAPPAKVPEPMDVAPPPRPLMAPLPKVENTRVTNPAAL